MQLLDYKAQIDSFREASSYSAPYADLLEQQQKNPTFASTAQELGQKNRLKPLQHSSPSQHAEQ